MPIVSQNHFRIDATVKVLTLTTALLKVSTIYINKNEIETGHKPIVKYFIIIYVRIINYVLRLLSNFLTDNILKTTNIKVDIPINWFTSIDR